MIFKQIFDTKSSTYTYLIASAKGREAIIIDPVLENVNEYIKILKESLYPIYGEKIKIEINEETVTSTPAQKKQIEKNDALKVATDSIKTDSKIENILNEFDAQIIESTIKSTKIN